MTMTIIIKYNNYDDDENEDEGMSQRTEASFIQTDQTN